MGLLVVWRGAVLGFALSVVPEPAAWSGDPVATTGRVMDEAGQPLAGVVVRVIGRPRIGTMTDVEGRFRLRRPARRDSLVLTYPGYQNARVLARYGQTIARREDTVVTEQWRDWLRRGGTY